MSFLFSLNGLRLLGQTGFKCRNRVPLLSESVFAVRCRPCVGLRTLLEHNSVNPTSLSLLCSQHSSIQQRTLFSFGGKSSKNANELDTPKDEPKKLTVFQRFTQVYKEYGKTLIVVHVVTSLLWFGGFYLIARRFVNVK